MKFFIFMILALAMSGANAASNLAIITKDAACAGKPVKAVTCVQTYNTPVVSDLVRNCPGVATDTWSNAACTWRRYDSLAPGERFEACGDDRDEGSPLVEPWCATYPWIVKQVTYPVTTTTKVYRLTQTKDKGTLTENGSIELGAKCDATQRWNSTYYVVPQAAVKFPTSSMAPLSFGECAIPTPVPPVIPPVIPPVGGSIKWHPGHYLRPSEQAFAWKDSMRFPVYDYLKDDSRYQGGLQTTPWGVIEPKQGQYDFTQIDKDLAYLKAMGKRLIVEIWWMNYWHDFNSRARGAGYVPDYLIDNGCAVASTGYNGVGYTVELHRAECMDRLIALFDALAKRYDNEPMFEQIIITEPSTPYAAWKPDPFFEQFKRLTAATSKSWTHTSVVFYMNWFTHAAEMAAYMAPLGVGIGGPDILPPQPLTEWGEDDGSYVLRGAGKVTKSYNGSNYVTDYGTVDYRGKIAVSYSYEAADAARNLSPAKLMPYALDTLKSTHVAWTVAGHLSPEMNYSTGVLPALKAANFRINTACPTVYAGRCVQ